MSMSQEEIESLMNGLDFEDEPTPEESPVEENVPAGSMSEDDINELIAQTEDMSVNEEDNNSSTEESVDDLLNSLEDIETTAETSDVEGETNIDDILKELEQNDNSSESEAEIEIPDELINPDVDLSSEDTIVDSEKHETLTEEASDNDIDDLLSTIDDMKEPETTLVDKTLKESVRSDTDTDNIGKGWTDNKIQEGIFPLPVEDDTKVVNQLSEVANDSEEKATKIFDVLSNILDYNNGIQSDVKELNSFNEKQIAMLLSLSQKFPNIDVFKENLTQAEAMGKYISGVNEKVNDGNNEIFQAMELMQFNDINRQKIERVMSVIRKLSTYLNNLFEDDGNRQEVAVANHIHGDSTEDLLADEDLESLIAEFNN